MCCRFCTMNRKISSIGRKYLMLKAANRWQNDAKDRKASREKFINLSRQLNRQWRRAKRTAKKLYIVYRGPLESNKEVYFDNHFVLFQALVSNTTSTRTNIF